MPFTVTRKPYPPSVLSGIPHEGATATPPAAKRAAERAEVKKTEPPKRAAKRVKTNQRKGKK
jgi:hypothetical protein